MKNFLFNLRDTFVLVSTLFRNANLFLVQYFLSFSRHVNPLGKVRQCCNKRLNIIKILSNKKWSLNQNTLGNLYKSLVGSILDYSFPCLNSFSENNIKKLQAIQNTAVRSILKFIYDTPSNIVHHEAFNKLKLLTVSNQLFELSERYVGTGLRHSIPLVERLVKEYQESFESRYIEYPTPLCNCYISISSFLPET
ncbi:RNA-directed DNA polymerase from mobile element jockey-like [Brachionus plicatilis]|uniref:RNA-directed DNA polymerase from mobile element jockey-like n=1 Tax=Brachionus plicatilis TaxID=10195 RepID=A0A3M7QYE3_BRAPC|nr:RNA-directed DNA polymerase from mobile element jockey-like [Brachionus plicatilis]